MLHRPRQQQHIATRMMVTINTTAIPTPTNTTSSIVRPNNVVGGGAATGVVGVELADSKISTDKGGVTMSSGGVKEDVGADKDEGEEVVVIDRRINSSSVIPGTVRSTHTHTTRWSS